MGRPVDVDGMLLDPWDADAVLQDRVALESQGAKAMSTCEIIAVPAYPDAPSGYAPKPWCRVHQMDVTMNGMCPVGQIEEATKKALAEICAEKAKGN